MSIKRLFTIATAVVTVLLIAGSVFALWMFATAESQLARALYSYEQLSIATGLESDAARSLLAEAQRRQGFEPASPLLVDRRRFDASVEALIARVRDEISSTTNPEEQAAEAEEFVAAFAIRENYARLERALAESAETGLAVDQQALDSFLALDRQLTDVIRDERQEVEVALAEVGAFRSRLRRYALLGTAAVVLAIIGSATFSYRGLMQPLRVLDAGSAELASGNIAHRIQVRSPPELRQLAGRLNDMASRLDSQRNALRQSNEQLEQTVIERTAQLAEKAESLEAIDASRRLFFAKVGHELRTPLTVLLGEAEVALSADKGSVNRYREALEHIDANGQHMKRRIADLLAVARSDDGRLRIEPSDTDLLPLAQATLDATRGYARSNDVHLALKTAESALWARADGDWLKQALMALIDNAIKFSPENATVELQITRDDEQAVLSVADRGAGVRESELALLVQPYFQGDNVPTRAGTGLGLAVAHWVAEQHHGSIEAHNRADGGLCVALRIPCRADQDKGTA